MISVDQATWMQSGVTSIVVASRGEQGRPSLGLGLGCRIAPDRLRLVVFLLEAQSHDLLTDLRAGRGVGVLFTQATTTRALQLKAPSAREVPLASNDVQLLDRYAETLADEWSFQTRAFTLALLSRDGDALVAFELAPTDAFDQTPGPRAGSPLGAGA